MKSEFDFIEKVQSVLDEGNSMNNAAKILNVHHSKINRLFNRGLLEIYCPFDEEETRRHLYQNFEWLWEEDVLEDILYSAFDGLYLLDRKSDDMLAVGKYVRDQYGGLKKYFGAKGFSRVKNYVKIKCYCCGEFREMSSWTSNQEKPWGIYCNCNICHYKTTSDYFKNNPQKLFESNQKRREMSDALPHILIDKVDWMSKRREYNWKCALTAQTVTISMDHFIPIAVGHGGTYFENLVPLSRSINSSKNDVNPYDWIKYNKEFKHEFIRIISKLSAQNSLIPVEYERFVNWCFDNRRTVEEIHADTRHSIEIWREATGIQFPLPAYVYKPRMIDEINEENEGGHAS